MVPEILEKGQIDALIDEEISHIFILTNKKKELETQKLPLAFVKTQGDMAFNAFSR